jgi:hypothetical protein
MTLGSRIRSDNSYKMMKKALPYVLKQVLGITADNALNNDKMIDELQLLLDDFPGPANQTRCFLHILSITAKLIIKQFDVPKAKNGVVMDDAAQTLADIADGLEGEELDKYEDQDCEDDEVDDEPLDPWGDCTQPHLQGVQPFVYVLRC